MNYHRSLRLSLLGLVISALAGCFPIHTYHDSYTRSKPEKRELAGTYTLASQTLSDQPLHDLRAQSGSSTSEHKLYLLSDGTFKAVGIPDWVKNENGKWQIRKFLSTKGLWELSSYTLNKEADEEEGTIWSIKFKGSGILDGASLVGNRAPYMLVMEFDEDGDNAMEFKREQWP
jgi:hypothetical protein